jgi:mannosyl-glycoprotein endo-beta-N-acetylglucosaminidase
VIGGPTVASGYTWWNIQTGSGSGWAAEDWLAANSGGTPGTPPPTGGGKFTSGQAIRVTESLNLRSGAGTSNGVVAVLSAGTTGTVIGGPTVASGYTWWNIQTGSGSGWAAEDWLAANSGGTPGTPPPTSGGIAAGDTVKVIDGTLNMRSAASLSGSIVAALPDATQLTVLSGPVSADGYLWYQVSGSYGSGWVAGVYIRKV